jgi:phosphate uptake regulator
MQTGVQLLQSKPNSETRKVQFTGGSTFIISLPKSWIIQNQLKKGSIIKLRQEEGGILSIVPPSSSSRKMTDEALIKVSSKESPEAVARKTIAAYLAGFNSISVKADKQQPLSAGLRRELKVFVRRFLVGTEIVTDTSSLITLQVLLSYPELTTQNVLRRMGIITSSMFRNAMAALKGHDGLLAKDVVSSDNEVDRFNLFVIRQLKLALKNPRMFKDVGLASGKDCMSYRLVTKSVERTADHAVSIAENVLLLKHEVNIETIVKIGNMSDFAITLFETALESLFKEDYSLAEGIIEKVDTVNSMGAEAIASAKMDVDDAPTLRMIIESIKRTAEYASDIAEIVLDLTIESILS